MKLPAKIEYACKAILELSLRYKANTPIQLNKIAQAQNIPQKFLIQILLRLKNSGVVNTSRGILGGYYLARPPNQISMAQVVRALDSNIVEIPQRAKSSEANRVIFDVWNEINDFSLNKLESVTFEDIANKISKKQFTYHI